MAKIKYLIKKQAKGETSNIYVRFVAGRSVDQCTKTGLFVLPENWNNEEGTIRQRAAMANKETVRQKLNGLYTYLENEFLKEPNKTELPKEWLKTTVDKYFNPEKYIEKKVTLFDFIQTIIEESKTRLNPSTGKKLSISTLKLYTTCYNRLVNYSKDKSKIIDFNDINLEFYHAFTDYLTNECQLATNTVGKQIATLKVFLNEATERGVNKNQSFKSSRFKVVSEDSEAVYLTDEELTQLYEVDLSANNRLDKVRDLFLVGCWTGCRFSDFSIITPSQVKGNMLHIEQVKTGHKVLIPLHPVVKSILEKYNGTLPDAPSNQKFNDYIKEVCESAGINSLETLSMTKGGKRISETKPKSQLVSSHTARRSFATNLYKAGFPSISIMAITGHKTERAFLKYIKVTPEEHASLLQLHWAKQGLHLRVS
ncbi:MAG: site-specific integrase [Marinilabiliaceae bacterium]|nr:site-specific integrase [Marinilabiliaceae bacterium]